MSATIRNSLLRNEMVDLKNVCEGKANNLFQHQLKKVIENIFDELIIADKEREITLKFSFKPMLDETAESRKDSIRGISTSVKASSKLAGMETMKVASFIDFGIDDTPINVRFEPNQMNMFDDLRRKQLEAEQNRGEMDLNAKIPPNDGMFGTVN